MKHYYGAIIQVLLFLIGLYFIYVVFSLRPRILMLYSGLSVTDLPFFNLLTPTGMWMHIVLAIIYLGFSGFFAILRKNKGISNLSLIIGSILVLLPLLLFIRSFIYFRQIVPFIYHLNQEFFL